MTLSSREKFPPISGMTSLTLLCVSDISLVSLTTTGMKISRNVEDYIITQNAEFLRRRSIHWIGAVDWKIHLRGGLGMVIGDVITFAACLGAVR